MISRVTSGGQRLSRLQRENQTLAKGENYLGGKMSFHTRRKNRVRNHTIKGLALAAGLSWLRSHCQRRRMRPRCAGATAGGSADSNRTLPGQVLWTYYDTTDAFTLCDSTTSDTTSCNVGGNGDNIIRLINPNGAGNAEPRGRQRAARLRHDLRLRR